MKLLLDVYQILTADGGGKMDPNVDPVEYDGADEEEDE